MAILEAQNINYVADGNQILFDCNFSLNKKEIVTISGHSGSGKSTFVKILASLLTQTSGKIYFEDENILDLSPIEYRRQVSYAVQQPTLFGETVYDNLVFPYDIRKQKFDRHHVIKALKTVDLKESDLDKPITSLSGGQKQRVALLRNLIFVPKILILDEVTTGLDCDTKASVHKMIDYYMGNYDLSVLMITHDNEELKHAKKVVYIEDGRIKEGTENE
ncbi:ATP-binding cassette domain-containing protein [Lactobacillus sp. S2-2]|uniref:ABC transporter ATP-binding protein n=1 Tax=Lactobacillus sp. S2-2 TaxID=2692917 RepID=UPI001F00E93F|nr:ATP-binding cassette domain-containing protein [Lactobacillus sp. S2-2]MCF6515248.1 ATP-binding cassette domain-containing protein [Lactobacillus sp. S2-2]